MVKTDFFYPKRKWHMLSLLLIFAISFFYNSEVSAQALACNDNVQVSLNQDCEADITPGMILEGEDEDLIDNYSVSIGGVSGTTVTTPGVYSVTVTDATTGNSCWGNITVEDKLAPSVEACDCPVGNTDLECQFLCTDLDGILNGTLSVPQPVVNENCGGLISEFTDQVTEGGCGEQIITRSWLFTDDSGNQSTGCTQQFTTLPVSGADMVAPVSPIELSCGADVSMQAIVEHFTPIVGEAAAIGHGFPTANGVAINGAICNLVATKVDLEIPVCDQSCSNSFKVIREWTILDWCTAEATQFTQIIKAVDNEAPTVEAQDMTVSTDPWSCEANFYLQAPSILHDDCTSFVDYTVTGPAGVIITYNAQANLFFATGAPKGIHTFNYIASDCCDNTATDPIQVTVTDMTAPVAVAKQNIVISLTQAVNSQGSAKIFAPSIDNGSHDGCTDVHLEIRRDNDECGVTGNTTYNNDGHSFDSSNDPDNGQFVRFCCEDITNAEVDVDGDGVLDPGYVKVWLRVWDDGDMNGTFGSSGDNFNETWAFVKVEDKLAPIITCPADITIDCDEDEDDLGATGTATATATCGDVDVTFNDIIDNIDNCGVGFVTRRWSVVGNSTVFCDQRITKEAGDLFDGNINFPSDFTTDCTDLDGNDDVPTWGDVGCSLVGYSLESDTFQFEDGACFKIINYWTVIDWCQYDPNSSNDDGIWEFAQIIKIIDDEAPVLSCPDQMYAVDDNDDTDNDGDQCEIRSLMLTNTADDNGDCASEWLKWTVLIDLWGDGTYDYEYSSNLPTFDSNFNDTNGNGIGDIYLAPTASGEEVKVTLPEDIPGSMNNHKVRWSVSDGCQNITSCENTFMVVDKKAPTPYCIDISTALMESGMVQLWACDFDLGSFDNCTEAEDLRFTFTSIKPQNDSNFNDATGCSSKVFDCDDLTNSPIAVEMYVWDEKDNFDFCEVMLTLVDNQGGCEDGAGMRISGIVKTPQNEAIAEAEVTLQAPLNEIFKFDMTNDEGGYAFFNNPEQATYNVSATKEGNYLDGVSTLDLVLIQRHILGLADLNDAHKVIAADINNDENLTASDLLQLRKLILGITLELPDNDSYKVIASNQTFADANQPWPLEEDINIVGLTSDMIDQDFTAIKIGDINGNASYNIAGKTVSTVRSEKTLNLYTENVAFTQGEMNTMDIRLAQTNALVGMQMSLNIDGLRNITVASESIELESYNYTVEGNVLNISWTALEAIEVNENEVLFTISGYANTNGNAAEAITTNTTSTLNAEAYNENLEVMNVDITSRSVETATEFAVLQNEPNPFQEKTVINYTIANEGNVSISITDITGKQVYRKTQQAQRGDGQFVIKATDLDNSGLYYYSISSGDKTVTNKMILIK